MLVYNVALTQDAEADLAAIYDYIAEYDCSENANYVLDELLKTAKNLSHFNEKCCIPKDLLDLGNRDYRQTLFKSYRLIYKIIDQQVVIFLITDGRRDMQALLTRRLLR